jgi:hypothetical protein
VTDCKDGCLPKPEIHVINLDTTNIEEAWYRIFMDAAIFGSATVKINWKDPEKATQFWGKSPLDDIKDKK